MLQQDLVDLLLRIGDGRLALPPRKPVTLGVLLTRCQVSSVISISTST
jgi:hypothetical protein